VTEHGRLFDDVAEAYDRFRPSYPAALIDEACCGRADCSL
jgi:hypothetical protein